MSTLGRALVSELDDADLDALAERLAPKLVSLLATREPDEDGWLDSKRAAAYLSMTRNALHKHMAARDIPFEQDGPGCKCWFKRSELNAWRENGGARPCPPTATHSAP